MTSKRDAFHGNPISLVNVVFIAILKNKGEK